ncbi:MAG: hypothetical protein ACREV2_02860 [Burkholderiales bacterium]
MRKVIDSFQRVPKWIVYLTILVVPGGLLVAPLVVALSPRSARSKRA